MLGNLKWETNFCIAPRRHAMNNLVARTRARENFTTHGVNVMNDMRNRLNGVHSEDFPNSAAWGVKNINSHLARMRIVKSEMIMDIRNRGGPRAKLQPAIYTVVMNHWKWYDEKCFRKVQKGDLTEASGLGVGVFSPVLIAAFGV